RIPQRRPHPVGAAGGAPVRQRCREPPLPHPELTLQSQAHRSSSLRRSKLGLSLFGDEQPMLEAAELEARRLVSSVAPKVTHNAGSTARRRATFCRGRGASYEEQLR